MAFNIKAWAAKKGNKPGKPPVPAEVDDEEHETDEPEEEEDDEEETSPGKTPGGFAAFIKRKRAAAK